MRDEGELDTVGLPEGGGARMDIEIPGPPPVMVPLDIVRVGVDKVRFANVVIPIDLENNLDIHLHTEPHIEAYLAPAQVKFLVEVIYPQAVVLLCQIALQSDAESMAACFL